MGALLDSIVKELKEMGWDDDPMGALLIEIATYANDPNFEFLVEKVVTESPLCTCEYYRMDPLLHEEHCPIRSLLHCNVDTLH